MNPANQLRFALNDRINDGEVSPSHVSLAFLGDFQKDVSEFLKGSNNEVDPAKVIISIEEGSLAIRAIGLLTAVTLWTDIGHLKSSDSLHLIDSKRASVVERWQSLAKKNPQRHYSIADESSRVSFVVNSTSNFSRIEDPWVHVEKYLQGIVVDIGGDKKPNVHLKLENGVTLPPIASTQEYLKENGNRLYSPSVLHVTAQENLHTGELRNLTLLAFEAYESSYDDDAFNLMVERGTRAWSDVPDATVWLENLRGSQT